MAQPERKKEPPKPRHVDRPEINETFADSLENIQFDGQTLRLEFVVHRYDPIRPPGLPTGRNLTACRVVLPAKGGLELLELSMLGHQPNPANYKPFGEIAS